MLGTLAITDPSMLADCCTRHPGAIIANIATKGGYVMIDGWQTQTAFRPQDIAYDLQMAGVAGIIHYDIDRLEDDPANSLALTMEMKKQVVIPVYSSGTVHNLDDMARLRYLQDIHGVIIGQALLEGVFTLEDALAVAHQSDTSPEPELESPLLAHGVQRPLNVYLAAYNLSLSARWWNQDLRRSITENNPYVEVVIPQEDLEIDTEHMSRREIQLAYEKSVDSADAVVVILDGIENEAWTAFECGYARAQGKFLLGVASQVENEARARFESMCDEVVQFDPEESRQTVLGSIAKEINHRLLSEGAAN